MFLQNDMKIKSERKTRSESRVIDENKTFLLRHGEHDW